MDWIKLSEVAEAFLANGVTKAHLPAVQLLVRGLLSGALLGFATTVAFTANAQGLPPVIGAILFPAGFAMIIVLGLELVTGSFAMVPAALFAREIGTRRLIVNLTLASPATSLVVFSTPACTPRCRRNSITCPPAAPPR